MSLRTGFIMARRSLPGSKLFCLASCLLAGTVVLAGCGKQPRIEGRIIDGFGLPLPNAAVNISGTAFRATTDTNGNYSIEYAPGKVSLQASKPGYSTVNRTFDIATAITYPAEQMTLYKIPAGKGIFLFGDADYLPVARGSIAFSAKTFELSINDPNFYENMADGPRVARIFMARGSFTPAKSNSKIRFLDNTGSSPASLMLVRLKSGDVILTRTIYGGGFERSDDAQIIKSLSTSTVQGLTIKEASLPPGRYAFVTLDSSISAGFDSIGSRHGGISLNPVAEPIYLFEVK